MKFDMHTHHQRCGHASGTIEDYIKEAIRLGLDVIGISDHNPPWFSDEDRPSHLIGIMMRQSEFPNYVAEVLQLKEKYRGKIEVLLGVEADYYPQHEERYRSKLAQFPFDYVIGSVHIVVPGATVFRTQNWIGRSDEEIIMLKERYYRYIQGSIRSGMYDIIGHMDALKVSYQKYVDTLPLPSFATFADIPTTEVDNTLKLLAESEKIIEVNSAFSYNFSNGTANWYPSHELLERACHYGVRVTFGSDAHDPYHVAWQREEVKAALRDSGYKEWYFFRGRKPVACPF